MLPKYIVTNVLIVIENFIIKVGVAACSFVVSVQHNYIVQYNLNCEHLTCVCGGPVQYSVPYTSCFIIGVTILQSY